MNPPIPITSTAQAGQAPHLTILVYGRSGSGKTYMSRTTGDLEHTLILSAESGLLALQDVEIPVMPIGTIGALEQAFGWLRLGDHPYRWVILDSLSEMAERILGKAMTPEAGKKVDGRAAYGVMQDRTMKLIRFVRDLPVNVVLIAKQGQIQDDNGRLLLGPTFPGKRLPQEIPYFVDEVFALIQTVGPEGEFINYLQTRGDSQYTAKDRSGKLDFHEPADLAHVASKIFGRAAATNPAEETT